jgi:hypothetical protein
MRTATSFALLIACLASADCAGTIAPPKTFAEPLAREAIVILPGFGYSADGERAIHALAPEMRDAGFDLYVPRYIRRAGLDSSGERLRRFLRERRLDRYQRVHVFAFLAGGWTFNELARDTTVLPNLASVVYDRSPYQERAPRLAAENLGLLSWLRYGSVLSEMAKTPYAPLARANVNVGLLIETVPTGFVKRFGNTARSYGPYAFGCGDFSQPHADCIYASMNHTELYTRFDEIWPELRAFIRDGRFSAAAERTAPKEVR